MRRLLLSLLFRLVDCVEEPINDTLMESWLADSWSHSGFKSYVAHRDGKMIREMAGGATLEPPPRDKAYMQAGQRFELLRLAQRAKQANDARKKKFKAP